MNGVELIGGTIQGAIDPSKKGAEFAFFNPMQAAEAALSGIYDGLYFVADAIYYPIDYGHLDQNFSGAVGKEYLLREYHYHIGHQRTQGLSTCRRLLNAA